MARFVVEVTKKIDFEGIYEKWTSDVEKATTKNTEQMKMAVEQNITNRGNIDTWTLVNNIQSRTTSSTKGNISTGVVESNVRSNPKGHRGYAVDLEYGTSRTMAYPNFRDALDEYGQVMFEKVKNISI